MIVLVNSTNVSSSTRMLGLGATLTLIPTDGAFQNSSATMDIWATNSSPTAIECYLEIFAYDLESGWSWSSSGTELLVLQPNSSTELRTAAPVPEPDMKKATGTTLSGNVVIQARLCAVDADIDSAKGSRTVMARTSDWPQPYKFIDFARLAADTKVSAEISTSGEQSRIVLSTTKPVKCLALKLESWEDGEAEVDLSDNAVSRIQQYGARMIGPPLLSDAC